MLGCAFPISENQFSVISNCIPCALFMAGVVRAQVSSVLCSVSKVQAEDCGLSGQLSQLLRIASSFISLLLFTDYTRVICLSHKTLNKLLMLHPS